MPSFAGVAAPVDVWSRAGWHGEACAHGVGETRRFVRRFFAHANQHEKGADLRVTALTIEHHAKRGAGLVAGQWPRALAALADDAQKVGEGHVRLGR